MDLSFAFDVIDGFAKLGGFAGFWAAWKIYKDGVPQIRSELSKRFYADKRQDSMELILIFYPGTRAVTIHSIELPDFDISVVTAEPTTNAGDRGLIGSSECTFKRGPVNVDWRIPASSESPEPLEAALIISRFNLNSLDAISLRVILRTKSIPFRICHDKFHKINP